MKKEMLVIFGAGWQGRDMLSNLDGNQYEQILFCDNNKDIIGTEIEGNKIIDLPTLKSLKKGNKIKLVIACRDWHSINKQLYEAGLVEDPNTTLVWNSHEKHVNKINKMYAVESFSLEGEDFILRDIFHGQENGTYVDIGAYDPFLYSNSHWASAKGWQGVNIDPNPESIEKFKLYREKDINLNIGISDTEGMLKYYMFEEGALNTFSSEVAEYYKKANWKFRKIVDVPVRRLDAVFAELGITQIDFMDIDVESMEMSVLKSNNWSLYRPKVILVEQFCEHRVPTINDILESEMHGFLMGKGYVLTNKCRSTLIYEERAGYRAS